MLTYLHCYADELWLGYEKNGLIRKNAGIRLPHGIDNPAEAQFNNIAAVGSRLYNYIKEQGCPFYVDRLQGGTYIYDYPFDKELIAEYERLLGDKFLGFQMHEWLSNYKGDAIKKLGHIPEADWNEETIKSEIEKSYNMPHLFLEAMTLSEMAAYGKPTDHKKFYNNMTAIYKDRLGKVDRLVPADSYAMMYPFEAECGAGIIMPEVGAQICDMRLQMSFARGVTRAYGIKLGAYYEPWGGEPFSACFYNNSGKNEWYISNENFPYKTAGDNGGSSRSLQWRTHLYAFVSNADYISEEWGGYNTFKDMESYELSEYGKVKRDFLDFIDKYDDLGDKLAPIAVVIPNGLLCLTLKETYDTLFGFELLGDERAQMKRIKDTVNALFCSAEPMQGDRREISAMKNSSLPDAVDMLNEGDGKALANYEYIVDLTHDGRLAAKHGNLISTDKVAEKLDELLPCKVSGGLHYVINKRGEDGYYLTVFNHSGIERSVEFGERVLESETKTVCIEIRDGRSLTALEGSDKVRFENGKYYVTVEGGGYFFAKF